MSSYTSSPAEAFHDVAASLVGWECRPGNTVSFLAEVDLSEVEAFRARAAAAGQAKPTYTAFVVKAAALALRACPYANRRLYRRWWAPFLGSRLQQFHDGSISVACERDRPGREAASFVDTMRRPEVLSLAEITAWLRGLASCDESNNRQWSAYQLAVSRLPRWLSALIVRLPVFLPRLWVKWRGGALVVSSPAKYGVDAVVATWPAPLGVSFGLVKERPVVRDGEVVARPTFVFTLNFDRRVMAGAPAARFFREIVRRLEEADLGESSSVDMGRSHPKGRGACAAAPRSVETASV